MNRKKESHNCIHPIMSSQRRIGKELEGEPSKKVKAESTEIFDLDILRHVYETLFPAEEFIQWLTYAHGDNLSVAEDLKKRELSFTLPGDIYCRYQGFANAEELRKQLVARTPIKIDIGAIYSEPMSRKDFKTFKPMSRELIFDIDMDDYSPIRHCCEGANVCEKCWKFMNYALLVLKTILTKEFGFKHILYVFSGRRGVHIWVCDRSARELTDSQRKAIVDYLSFSKINQKIDYSLREAAKQLRPFFEEVMINTNGQDVLRYDPSIDDMNVKGDSMDALLQKFSQQRFFPLLECLPSNFTKQKSQELKRILVDSIQPEDKWKRIEKLLSSDGYDTIEKIILTYTYPRLDKNVSLLRHHLLKSPFIVHPKSHRFCCPIDPDQVESFVFSDAPSMDDIFENPESLQKYRDCVEMFKTKFLRPLQRDYNIEDGIARGKAANAEEEF
ncbi:hypothetical protein WA171_002964, partial [Blastocystis sp. BT1]